MEKNLRGVRRRLVLIPPKYRLFGLGYARLDSRSRLHLDSVSVRLVERSWFGEEIVMGARSCSSRNCCDWQIVLEWEDYRLLVE